MATQFNKQQLEVINSDDRTILCLSAAGVGKTTVLLARIERLVKQGVDPRTILAITFTNAAAFEMKERYKKLPVCLESSSVPEFRTFHGFCYSLIVKDVAVRNALGYSLVPELCEENDYKKIRTLVKESIGCKLSDARLDNGLLITKAEKDQKELLEKALTKYMRQNNLITFDIICYGVCDLFIKNDPVIMKYKEKYKYIMLDEAQDTDKAQFNFIASFPATTNFFICGDILQNLYSFRGCTNDFIKTLALDPNWKVIKLFENYRSTTNICNFANKFSKYAKDEFRIQMHGQRDGEDPIVIHGSNTSYTQPVDKKHLEKLVEMIKENKNETAVLCRTNKEVECVKKALTDADIKINVRSKSTDTLNYIESVISNDYFLEWLTTKLEAKDYSDFIRLSALEKNVDI